MTSLRLPKRSSVYKTGRTDPIMYHYQPVVRHLMNRRLSMALRLLGDRHFARILDAGCGGGVFLPELARRCDNLHAIDVHDHLPEVRHMIEAEGITADIQQESITETGFPDQYFDCIVSISVLEFLPDVGRALDELVRIAKPGASVVLGFPGDNVLIDAGYRCIRAPAAHEVHQTEYREILAEAGRRLSQVRLLRFPVWLPTWMSLYFVCELEHA